MNIIKLFLLVSCVSISSSFAQSYDDFLNWSWIRVQGSLDNPIIPGDLDESLLGSVEYHYRMNNDASDFQGLILRPMVGYKLTDSETVWLGYAYIESNRNGEIVSENRMFQMISYGHKLSKAPVVFVGNTRIEERMIGDSEQTAFRLRQMLRVSFDLFKIKKSKVVGFIQNEYFLSLNETDQVTSRGFDQNRFLVGLSLQSHFGRHPVSLNVGYMNNLNHAGQSTHGVNVGVFITIPNKKPRTRRR
jgi:hypothetical protein